MIDALLLKTWAYRAGFVFLALLLTFTELLPLNTLPASWVMPDVLLCVTFVCCIRRPQYVPMLIIAVVFLFQDLLLNQRLRFLYRTHQNLGYMLTLYLFLYLVFLKLHLRMLNILFRL